jgi:hypothetical protein
MEGRYVAVATQLDPQTANLMRSRLEASGIPCVLRDQHTTSNLGGPLGAGLAIGIRLEVERADEDRARKVLDETPDRSNDVIFRVRRNRSFLFSMIGLCFGIGCAHWITNVTLFAVFIMAASGVAGFWVGKLFRYLSCSGCLARTTEQASSCERCGLSYRGTVGSLQEAAARRLDTGAEYSPQAR